MLIVQPEAEADLQEAFNWYEGRETGLGNSFMAEVDAAFARIAQQPLAYPEQHIGTRRASLRRFPCTVSYVVRDGTIHVLPVLHPRRHPKHALVRAQNFKP